jgi:protein-L-isoaspartate O-methyltransferase
VVVCYSTEEYRRLARSQVDSRDSVLEVGSSMGVCTAVLAQHSRSVLGCDSSGDAVQQSRAR